MPFHSGQGGLIDSAFELIGGALGGALFGPPGAVIGGRLGGAIIRDGQMTASSVAPITAQVSTITQPQLGGPGPILDTQRGFADFAPIVREGARIIGPPIARELGSRFLGGRGDMPSGTSGAIALPGPNGAVVCKPISQREAILMQARSASPGATARKIIAAAKTCGIAIASQMFGISMVDVCHLVINAPRRRSKGISARDMRTTNRTLRGIDRVRKNAKKALGGR